jgi:predicted transposase/invertase (TIGR01784 family)
MKKSMKEGIPSKDKFYPLLDDFIFKQVFGDHKNTGRLALLLEPLIPLQGKDLSSLTIKNTFLHRSRADGKLSVLDVRAETDDGREFDVEVQIQKARFFHDRLVYYQSKLLSDQLRKGYRYEKLRPVYCIAICNFIDQPGLPGYIHYYEHRDRESGTLFTGLQNTVIIELPKMPREDDGSGAWPVLECFRCKTAEEAEMHAKTYPKVRDIVEELKRFSLGRELRAVYDMRLKASLDRKMWEDEFHARGLERGLKEGMEQGLEQGAAREREKWEAVRFENEAARSKIEALERELARLRRDGEE